MLLSPRDESIEGVFDIQSSEDFNAKALQIFHYQRASNLVYRRFLTSLGKQDLVPSYWNEIPCLPISAYKHHQVLSGLGKVEAVFTSSGTTSAQTAEHHVRSLQQYEDSFRRHFELRYGPVEHYCVLGLLPAYIERGGSSLVYMVDRLIAGSNHADSGTYLHDHTTLRQVLSRLKAAAQPTILIGVSYALLDLIEEEPIDFSELIVMETGGMKGRREEMIREELHALLQKGFGVEAIHSEYGMTELLSQAYSSGSGLFYTPPWMQVRIRDIMDPYAQMGHGRTGGIDIIDLANIDSCSFISTDDLGRSYEDGSFEVLGRYDMSDVRGCSLLIS